jgi:prophage regulatory protein
MVYYKPSTHKNDLGRSITMGNGGLIWREPKVRYETKLSKSTRWRLEKLGLFPQKVKLGPRATGWIASEILEWLEKKAAAR